MAHGDDAQAVEVTGRRLLETDDLVVTEVPGAGERTVPRGWVAATSAGWAAWFVLLGAARVSGGRRLRAARYR